MPRLFPLAIAFLLMATLGFTACGDDDAAGGDRRLVRIVQQDDACTPSRIELKVRDRVSFEVVNQSKADQEIEGEDGTKLEELLVPAGKTRVVNFNAPDKAGTGTIKCYRPGGQTTMIQLAFTD